jgi:hypothetical protein
MVGTGLMLFGLGRSATADMIDFYGGPTYAGAGSSASYSGGIETLTLGASSSSFKVSDLTTSTVLLGPTAGSASISAMLNGYTPASGNFGAQHSSSSQGTGTASFTETVGSGLNEYTLSGSGSATWYETAATIWITLPSFTYTAPGGSYSGQHLFLELEDVSGSVNQSPLTTAIQTDAIVSVPLPASAVTSAGLLAVLGLYGLCRRRRVPTAL